MPRHLGPGHAAADPRFDRCCWGRSRPCMALRVQSVQKLWFFTSDLVFVILFPQLVYALFDPQPIAPARSRPSACRSCCGWAAANRCWRCRRWSRMPSCSTGACCRARPTSGSIATGHATLFPIRTVAALRRAGLAGGRFAFDRPLGSAAAAAAPPGGSLDAP